MSGFAMHRSVFLCFTFVFFLVAGTSWADVQSIKSLLANGENQGALEAAQAINTESAEIKHLIAVAKMRLVNQRSIANPDAEIWLPGELEEIEGLLKSASDERYGPAMFDYAFIRAIGAQEASQDEKSVSREMFAQLTNAFRAGEPMAALTLYENYCSGEAVSIDIVELERTVSSISNMPTDADSEVNFVSIFDAVDDDELVRNAKRSLAKNLATGSCGRLDKAEARRIYDSLIGTPDQFWIGLELGNIVSRFKGAELFSEVRNQVQANPAEAFDWLAYKVRSGRGSYDDYMKLAEALLTGTGTPKNYASASSAVAACYREEKLRDNIYCSPYNVDRLAQELLTTSASSGGRHSQEGRNAIESLLGTIAVEEANSGDMWPWVYAESLGDAYYNGDFGTPNLTKALELYRVAAASGSVRSQFLTGYMYSQGEGTPVDGKEAARFYEIAAANGDSTAAHNLGWLYAYSGLITKNDVVATNWYRRSADLGDLDAIAILGKRISEGTGTLENDVEAVRWLTKAAEAGQKFAQKDLAFMYANGEGVDQNFVAAYKWANLSGGQGVDVSAIKSWLSARMNRDEVTRAQSLSAAWKPTLVSDASPKAESFNGSGSTRPAEPDELTLEIQVGLSKLGFLAGRADGLFGPKTRAAIEAFQRQHGLQVTGAVSPQLATQIGRALSAAPATKSRPYGAGDSIATGTGFVVSSLGHLVTNAHVVTGCQKMTLANGTLLTMQAYDPVTDLALLKSSALEGVSPLFLRGGSNVEVAESVAVAGFPLSGLVSPDLNVTLGNVSALSGPDGSKSLIQITAPVQPGNSGGPILDESGSVVGVVVSKLDAIAVATITGDIPQNVNFGISLSELKAFLNKQGVPFSLQAGKTVLKSAKIGELARASTFQVQCH
jgi:uncharacterized protein